jgi:hypothetical protein
VIINVDLTVLGNGGGEMLLKEVGRVFLAVALIDHVELILVLEVLEGGAVMDFNTILLEEFSG